MPAPQPDKPIDPVPPQLPDEEFWEKYNDRLEFPLSAVAAVFLHVAVALFLFLLLPYLSAKTDDSPVPIKFVDVGGDDPDGAGSEGSGGDEIVGISSEPIDPSLDNQPKDRDVPNPEANPTQPTLSDPLKPTTANKNSVFTAAKNNPGKGNAGGTGGEGRKGTGPGGFGNDATRARQENWSRWVISFSTFEGDGRDYLNQLGAFGATLLVPRPGGTEYLVYDDILHHLNFRVLSVPDAEKSYSRGGGYVWFSEDPAKYPDAGRKSKSFRTIGDVARALKLDFTPEKFWAVFPKEVDQMLADRENAFIARVRAETQFTNLSVDDIQTTVFAVDRQSGGKQVDVVRIVLKDDRNAVVNQNGRLVVRQLR
jgi:hypothetical protein